MPSPSSLFPLQEMWEPHVENGRQVRRAWAPESQHRRAVAKHHTGLITSVTNRFCCYTAWIHSTWLRIAKLPVLSDETIEFCCSFMKVVMVAAHDFDHYFQMK